MSRRACLSSNLLDCRHGISDTQKICEANDCERRSRVDLLDAGTDYCTCREVGTEHQISDGGAGTDCGCVVSVSRLHYGLAGPKQCGGTKNRSQGFRGARVGEIWHKENRAVEPAFPFDGREIPGRISRGCGESS